MLTRSFRPSLRSVGLALLALVSAAVVISGCGAGASPSPAPGPTIADAWVRAPAGVDQPVAAYLTIHNPGDAPDVLVGVESPVALTCQLHETAMDSGGMTGMHEVHDLEIPAHGTVRLEPGGYHLMLTGVGPLTTGASVELRLSFRNAGTVVVEAQVRNG